MHILEFWYKISRNRYFATDEIIYYNESLTLTMGYARFPLETKASTKNLMRTCAQPAMQRRASTKTPKIRNQIKNKTKTKRQHQRSPAIAYKVSKTQKVEHGAQEKIPPNGALSRRSSTRSSTLLRCRLTSACFSIGLLVTSAAGSPLPFISRPKAPASLLGLRWSMAGTESRAPAEGMLGDSGRR